MTVGCGPHRSDLASLRNDVRHQSGIMSVMARRAHLLRQLQRSPPILHNTPMILPTTNCEHKNVIRVALPSFTEENYGPAEENYEEGEYTCEPDCR
jgi:hypothetical protein